MQHSKIGATRWIEHEEIPYKLTSYEQAIVL